MSTNGSNAVTEETPILRHSSQDEEENDPPDEDTSNNSTARRENEQAESRLRRKVDLRLCSIAGVLCSLNLLDSGIISSAAVTSMLEDLELTGNRYSVAIFIFTVASICFQLPATITMRVVGPRIFFASSTCLFGAITICTAFITSWRQMIVLRVLLGIAMSGIYPGLIYLISTWYTRREQQLRFAFLQSGQVIILATGSIVNYGLNHLDHFHNLRGWQWMYLVQGSVTVAMGLLTYFWIVDFPENSQLSFRFLTPSETQLAIARINHDRSDAGHPTTTGIFPKPPAASSSAPLTWTKITTPFADPKLYAFSILFFLHNLVSTALSYFLPQILHSLGFTANQSILLTSFPYYYSVIPVLLSSHLADTLGLRGPIISFNAVTLIIGFALLGFSRSTTTARYIGIYLATGAYISNWAALSAYQANNITGQWKRATVAAAVAACNGLGGIAGSYIVRADEAPSHYPTAIRASIASQIGVLVVVAVCTFGFWTANR